MTCRRIHYEITAEKRSAYAAGIGHTAGTGQRKALKPETLLEQVRDRDEGDDRRSRMILEQSASDGFVRERELLMLEKKSVPSVKPCLHFTAPAWILPVPAF